MKIDASYFSSKGLQRENNEDSYLSLTDGSSGIFVVADGMGGHFGGEIASNMLVSQLNETWGTLKRSDGSMPDYYEIISSLKNAIRLINDEIYNAYSKQGNYCGTTFALIAVCCDNILFMNAGDTRIYSCRGTKLSVESIDHVYCEEEKLKGTTSSDMKHADQVTSAIGISQDYKLDIKSRPVRSGKFLICSDGVYKYMSEIQIFTAMNCKNINDYIVKKVTSKKAKDNYTYILIKIS